MKASIPEDVESLISTLFNLNIDNALVLKAQDLLTQNAGDLGKWNELAIALRQRKEYHAALVTYDTATLRFPNAHVLCSNKGYVLLEMELYEEASNFFSKALAIQPDYTYALT